MTAQDWDSIFAKQQWGRYPSEMVVREVMGFLPRLRIDQLEALDLGCGAGANTTLLAENGFQVVAVDGSIEALKQAEVSRQFRRVYDMVQLVHANYITNPLPPYTKRFNVIVDWLSLTHASPEKTVEVARRTIADHLAAPGRYILGLFGTETDLDALDGRPPIVRWSDIDLAGLGRALSVDALGCGGSIVTRYHLEEQIYTRKGKRVQVWCLVIEND
jgi:SAM-dependent methyltransferase